jgi:hypothetical protein
MHKNKLLSTLKKKLCLGKMFMISTVARSGHVGAVSVPMPPPRKRRVGNDMSEAHTPCRHKVQICYKPKATLCGTWTTGATSG